MQEKFPTIAIEQLYTTYIPGIDEAWGRLLAKAGSVHLSAHGHPSNVLLHVHFAIAKTFNHKVTIEETQVKQISLIWEPSVVDARSKRAWADIQETTEHAASGIACLLIIELTDYTIIERAFKDKDHGFDYWLGYEHDLDLMYRGRLEVSGIFNGKESDIDQRVRRKIQQLQSSDHLQIPAYAVVVEFSFPRAKMVQKL